MLQFKPFHAPHVYTFKDPDTGQVFTADSRSALVQRIVNYRAQNSLPEIERFDAVLENYLCSLPVHRGACRPAPPLQRGWVQTIKGGIALLKNLYYGDSNMVTQEEADRRSLLCSKCPNNNFPDKGPFIKWSDEIAMHSVGERRSSCHSSLGNCTVCSCPLRAKVWYAGPFSVSPEERSKMLTALPPSEGRCWQIDTKDA